MKEKVFNGLKWGVKKWWVWLIFIFVVFIIITKVASASKREDDRAIHVETPPVEQLSESEKQQQALVQQFGEAPSGFRWDLNGQLVALGDNAETPEVVGYAYIRALSQLAFSTSAKYSSSAVIGENYNAMYNSQTSTGINQFTRSIYKQDRKSTRLNSSH